MAGDLRLAALAVAGWAVAATCVPWILAADQSVIDGDGGAAVLIAAFGGAGLASVGAVALARRRRSAAGAPRSVVAEAAG